MKKLFFAMGLILSISAAQATDFTGHWTGSGVVTMHDNYTGNRQSPCSLIDITLEHLPTRLTIRHYHAICSGTDPEWGPAVMEIREGKIYEDGEEDGTIDGDTLKTLQPDGGAEYAFNLRLKATAPGVIPILETYYGVRNLAGAIVIEGDLRQSAR